MPISTRMAHSIAGWESVDDPSTKRGASKMLRLRTIPIGEIMAPARSSKSRSRIGKEVRNDLHPTRSNDF